MRGNSSLMLECSKFVSIEIILVLHLLFHEKKS